MLPCPVPHHPLASEAVTPAAAPRPARLLHAETHTPKSPWVKLLGSSHQLLFPSVPKPSEEIVENKEVSVQGALSQSAAGLGSRGCSWSGLSSVPSQEGQPAPAGRCCERRPTYPLTTPPNSCLPGQPSRPDAAAWPKAGLQPCFSKLFWCLLAESCW